MLEDLWTWTCGLRSAVDDTVLSDGRNTHLDWAEARQLGGAVQLSLHLSKDRDRE